MAQNRFKMRIAEINLSFKNGCIYKLIHPFSLGSNSSNTCYAGILTDWL
jgi:hypothetical protein